MNDNERMIELLAEAVRWLRFQSVEKADAAVGRLLDTDQKKMAFELADGVNSARGIAPQVGVTNATISNWWNEWAAAGILFEHNKTYKKLFSLADLGIEKPETPTKPTVAKRAGNGSIAESSKML